MNIINILPEDCTLISFPPSATLECEDLFSASFVGVLFSTHQFLSIMNQKCPAKEYGLLRYC